MKTKQATKSKRKTVRSVLQTRNHNRKIYDDRDDPNHGDGLNDSQRAAQRRFVDNDSLGGETGRYLDSIRGTMDDPGE